MIQGFDISFWQGKINFNIMKQHGQFVIIRQGQALFTDSMFRTYWLAAKDAGLVRMAYHFFTWAESPEAQAEKFVSDLSSAPPDRIRFEGREISGYWGDFEWWSTVPSNALELYGRFADRVKDLTGMYPGIYTARGFWMSYGSNNDIWAEMPLWSAEWNQSLTKPTNFDPWKRLGKNIVIWQNGTPAIGNQVGVESLEIDSSVFMGTSEELQGEISMPNVYEGYAKSIYIDEKSTGITVDFLKNFDVVIAKGVSGQTFIPGFHTWVQMAYDAGKPLIMFVEHRPDLYVSYNTLPLAQDDFQWKVIKQALYSGTQLRAIHGVMINASMTYEQETGKTIPDVWISTTADHIINIVEKETGLPVMMYMDKNPINAHPGSAHIVGLIERRGISTYSAVSNLVNGVPADGLKPSLAYWGTKDWDFWMYQYLVDTKTIASIYRGSKAALYSRLKYTSGDPGTPPPPPVVPDLEQLKTAVANLMVAVNNITTSLASLAESVAKLEAGVWKYQK